MILGFMQKFPWGAPTKFREKILTCGEVERLKIEDPNRCVFPISGVEGQPVSLNRRIYYVPYRPKLHTMREDKPNKWNQGRVIQMVYRGPKYSIIDRFNENHLTLKMCVSTQRVVIENWNHAKIDKELGFVDCKIVRGVEYHNYWMVWIDDRKLTGVEIEQLAINDGFDNAHDFFRWFKKDWKGKLIHWTDLKY